ncbi:hypothetical protein ADU59_03015 [Pararhizobium polonicum]|uniref:Uncharacterized protein n=1 Tax=Pararhizobium polonicum TaxID=1612624 RepID=A0A1C7P642_9HYPH|nr:hypothetical protein [Pararhizobium polonicum]OBZ96729.1 hypothetical protein ADU59_03015 [Pararhizobium polonicum]
MDDADRLANHELAHDTLRKSQDYIGRGRHLQGLANSDLEFEFISSVRLVARDGNDAASRLAMNDAQAEFDLRGVSPPFDQIGPEITIMARRGRDKIAAMPSEELDRIEDGINERYRDAASRRQ